MVMQPKHDILLEAILIELRSMRELIERQVAPAQLQLSVTTPESEPAPAAVKKPSRNIGKNGGRLWGVEDTEAAIVLKRLGFTTAEIAAKLGRSRDGVVKQLWRIENGEV